MYEREIRYDPESAEFAMILNGIIVGFARTYLAAEEELNRIVYNLIKKG